jgi:peptide deformylase
MIQHEIGHLNGSTIIDEFLETGGSLELIEKILPERS